MVNDFEEVWKPIMGFEDIYEVSTLGNIRSIDRYLKTQKGWTKFVKGNTMKPQYDKYGYKVIHLRDAKKSLNKLVKVHRLVAIAFIENPNGYDTIDHINGIRDDNRVENLRWCTVKQNANFEPSRKRKSVAIKNSYDSCDGLRSLRAEIFRKAKQKQIIVYKDGEKIDELDSIKSFYTKYNLCPSTFQKYFKKNGNYLGYSYKIK